VPPDEEEDTMEELDEDQVRAGLPAPEAKLFLALGRAGIPDDPDDPSKKIQEYLGFLEDHFGLEANKALRDEFPQELLDSVAQKWRDLLAESRDSSEAERLLVVTGVRYFVNPHDVVSELVTRHGMCDDVRVLNFVIQATGSSIAPLPQPEEGEANRGIGATEGGDGGDGGGEGG
jgi:uncharacterized membrane protein YkvA (DUF1232 family)